MFCIKSDVITLEFIEIYGFVTIWTSMDDGPYWVNLLMYGSHDMRYIGFRRLTVVNETPGFWGVTFPACIRQATKYISDKNIWLCNLCTNCTNTSH